MPRPSAAMILAEARKIQSASSARGRGRKSPVRQWLEQNYAEIAPAIESKAVTLTALAQSLAKQGLNNADGKPLTLASLSSTLERIRVSRAAARQPGLPLAGVTRTVEPAPICDSDFSTTGKKG